MINPCDRCPLGKGYGAAARCADCEVTYLRKENVKKAIQEMKAGKLPKDKSFCGLDKRT